MPLSYSGYKRCRRNRTELRLRLAGFSVFGAAIYVASTRIIPLPPPLHLFPSTFQGLTPTSADVFQVAISFAGHLAASAIAGVIAVAASKVLARLASASVYPGAWDDFARVRVRGHWVIVGLSNGDVYAGKLKIADVAVASGDRDLVLEEPCRFDSESSRYMAVNYQYLFVPAGTWFSIAAVHEPGDERVIPVGEYLFTAQGAQGEK